MFSYFLSIKEQVPTKESRECGFPWEEKGRKQGLELWDDTYSPGLMADQAGVRDGSEQRWAKHEGACPHSRHSLQQPVSRPVELQHPYPLSSWPGASAVSGTGNVWSESGIIWGWANFVVCFFLHMPVHFWWMNNQMSKKTTPVLVLTTPFEQ